MINKSLLRKFSTICLTEQEAKVFTALLDASTEMGKQTTLRAAGGWVRDKLLGGESSDIDIALDNVPGDVFSEFLHQRERSKGNISSIGIVKENPDQSKHIRTASFRFHGIDFDINNLRSETYTESSRIPEVKFAKHPSEDAFRRDFTINALYYNLNTREVEDFTGTGLSDLESGIVRTPLPASRTFVDDPLRVLRAVRFASRFEFKLDPEIVDAWAHEDVRAGLMNKVSRERIGVEICKMMRDANAFKAVGLFLDSGLLELILQPPLSSGVPSLAGVSAKDYGEWKKAWAANGIPESDVEKKCMRKFRIVKEKSNLISQNESFYFNLSVLLLACVRKKASPNAALVARLALKLSSADSKAVGNLLSSLDQAGKILSDSAESAAVNIGRLARGPLKEHVRTAFILFLVSDPGIGEDEIIVKVEELDAVISKFNLSACHTWKPVLDGAEIQTLLSVKPGKRIQQLLSIQFDMMFLGDRCAHQIKERLIAENAKLV
jgi:tRNA nucleotidyltransferase/poly(A) polymerase